MDAQTHTNGRYTTNRQTSFYTTLILYSRLSFTVVHYNGIEAAAATATALTHSNGPKAAHNSRRQLRLGTHSPSVSQCVPDAHTHTHIYYYRTCSPMLRTNRHYSFVNYTAHTMRTTNSLPCALVLVGPSWSPIPLLLQSLLCFN